MVLKVYHIIGAMSRRKGNADRFIAKNTAIAERGIAPDCMAEFIASAVELMDK